MHAPIIFKILGILLMLFSILGNIPPILVSIQYDDGMIMAFVYSLLIIGSSGDPFLGSTRDRWMLAVSAVISS